MARRARTTAASGDDFRARHVRRSASSEASLEKESLDRVSAIVKELRDIGGGRGDASSSCKHAPFMPLGKSFGDFGVEERDDDSEDVDNEETDDGDKFLGKAAVNIFLRANDALGTSGEDELKDADVGWTGGLRRFLPLDELTDEALGTGAARFRCLQSLN